MQIRSVSADVRSLAKLGSATRGYAALDAPAFVLCRVAGENGLVGRGVTGRFLATRVAGLIAGGMALSEATLLHESSLAPASQVICGKGQDQLAP